MAQKKDKKEEGYVYIFSNVEQEGLLKVGMSTNHPEIRAYQMNSQTTCIGKWIVEWFIKVPNCRLSESLAHEALKDSHFIKEYYAIEVPVAIFSCKRILGNFWNNEELEIYSRQSEVHLKLQLELLKIKIELGKRVERRKLK